MRIERLDGVHTSMPATLPEELRGREVVVAGESVDAALRLAEWGSAVTFVTARTSRVAAAKNVTVLYGSEIVCVDGIERLESVVVRKIRTGVVSARNAAALFLMEGERS